MNSRSPHSIRKSERGSVLVIVLCLAFGLVSIALYFADSMSQDLRASDNRVSGLAADQAIEGAQRYVTTILSLYATNGCVPDLTQYQAEAVPVGSSHFWIIGREPSGTPAAEPYFALIAENSKLYLNRASTNTWQMLPLQNLTPDFVQSVRDWRTTNGAMLASINYAPMNYAPKGASFETLDELRLVYGSSMDLLAGEDVNRNGVLDENETDTNGNGQLDPGLFEYVSGYGREPNLHADGSSFTNVNNQAQFRPYLVSKLGSSRAGQIMARLVRTTGSGRNARTTPITFSNLLQFYLTSGMNSTEFGQIANDITASSGNNISGRININTASPTVLQCLPGMDLGTAQQLVSYRQQNANNLTSIAWIVDALGASSPVIQSLAQGDYITIHSFQFTADIAAIGPYGRGYRRTKFIFDLSAGQVRIIYRQDLSRLGWALGKNARATYVTKEQG